MRTLVTGATGFVGGRLAAELLERGDEVACLVRDAGRAAELERAGTELYEGDVLERDSLAPALEGADVAYYLIHGMGRGSGGDFAERERHAARNFAAAVREAGVARTVYLGGLGSRPRSQHLKSRHETGRLLAAEGPPLSYFRAAMVVGSGSESYKTLRHLVSRLPVMVAPSWLKTRTQPIDVDDVVAYLAQAPGLDAAAGREIEIGGPDVVSYGEMLDRMAVALGKRPRPKLPVPVLSPGLSSRWIGLVTPVDAGVARPLVEGLSTETVVEDPSAASLFDVTPMGIDAALRKAIAEENGSLAPVVP
jgi:uncharacterized protein YbjT (DUF2867 family)